MPSHPNRVALGRLKAQLALRSGAAPLLLWMLCFLCACGHPPANDSANSDSQKLPFDRQPRSTGISPSQSIIPSTTKLPEGTTIPVRLESTLSSASSHAGDSFKAVIDEPIQVDGQTLVAPGTPATGRVLEARPSAGSLEPGYLRIVLVSLKIDGKQFLIETSSIFAKGSREERNSAAGMASGANQSAANQSAASQSPADQSAANPANPKDRDIVFGPDRHLSFRLAQSIDLQ